MSIKVGDRVRWRGESFLVRYRNDAEACIEGSSGLHIVLCRHLAATSTSEPAPAPLTGAQVAQVLDAWTDAYVKALAGPSSESALVQEMCAKAQAERERDNAG